MKSSSCSGRCLGELAALPHCTLCDLIFVPLRLWPQPGRYGVYNEQITICLSLGLSGFWTQLLCLILGQTTQDCHSLRPKNLKYLVCLNYCSGGHPLPIYPKGRNHSLNCFRGSEGQRVGFFRCKTGDSYCWRDWLSKCPQEPA